MRASARGGGPALAPGPAGSRAPARFAALGFPTVRDEEWRFTNVAPIAAAEFGDRAGRSAHVDRRAARRVPLQPTRRSASCSSTAASCPGCRGRPGCRRACASGRSPRGRREHADSSSATSASSPSSDTRAFTALNTALAADGAYVYVPDGAVLEQPIHVLFVDGAADAATDRCRIRGR